MSGAVATDGDGFERFADADAVRWNGEMFPIVDAGEDVSSHAGRHLAVDTGRDEPISLHERLVTEWGGSPDHDFEPVDTE